MMANILIVEARYDEDVCDALLDGATAVIEKAGAHFDRVAVPSALEVPSAIALAARAGANGGKRYDGYVALGCFLPDGTIHFEIVAAESARGLIDLGVREGLCIGNGIIVSHTHEHALSLADAKGVDRGGEAARACISLIDIRNRLGGQHD